MSNKFLIGDKVVINRNSKRLPVWIKNSVRLYRIRTIKAMFYYPTANHTAYYLGGNKTGEDLTHYPFRAEELKPYQMKHTTKLRKQRLLRKLTTRVDYHTPTPTSEIASV